MRRIALVAVLATASALLVPASPSAGSTGPERLYLVTLEGSGVSGYDGPLTDGAVRRTLEVRQDRTLGAVGDPEPVYRWTEALNGYAVRLTADQAGLLAEDPDVALVERDVLRSPAAGGAASLEPGGPRTRYSTGRGGQGVVVGVVDSGLWAESPLFSGTHGLGRAPRDFRGECAADSGLRCDRKVVGARWFADGFGRAALSTTASLSAHDDTGHGTLVASLAVGNARVSMRASGESLGTYAGAAPQARLAVYKACWTAPDPADDGCSTADLVAAVDAATADRVDVLNLSVAGSSEIDTLQRALLGAAEADIVVVGAAGNAAGQAYAAHAGPWVTSVGASDGVLPLGSVRIAGGPRVEGVMVSDRRVGPTRIVLAARATASGAAREDATVCRPGSLDAARVRDRIVVCARGAIGRVDKSAAVRQAGGAGMVLVDVQGGAVAADAHAVPSVQLDGERSRRLTRWLARHRQAVARLVPTDVARSGDRVLAWSSPGDPTGLVVKPDLVAPGTGLVGAVPPHDGNRVGFLTGSSGSAAQVSGLAARLRSAHRSWSAAEVRSALATGAAPLRASVLRQGAGRASQAGSARPGLLFDVPAADYRRVLDGDLDAVELNTPSLLVGRSGTVVRRVTNAGSRAMYFSSATTGFRRDDVRVTPAALRLAPGDSADFTVTVSRQSGVSPVDEGYVVWRGANGARVRVPVVLTR